MSTNEQIPLSQPTSAVRNTLGREQAPQNLVRPVPDEDLQDYCDKNYHQILPIIAEKLHQEKVQQEKLKVVKARLNFEEASQYSKSETPNRRRNLKERLGPRGARTRSISPEQRSGRSKSPKEKGPKRRTVFKRLEKGVFHRLRDKEKNVSAHSRGSERKSYYRSRKEAKSCYQSSRSKETEIAFEIHRYKREYSRRTEAESESEGSAGGHWKSKPKKQNHIKTYDGSEDPEDHLKIFQAAVKTKRWATPTWCHMFNSTLIGNARKKCIKDPVEIHNIKQRNRESTEEFVRRYKLECMDVKGAPECMKISGFMHKITNPELIKRLHDKIPQSMYEMMSVTAAFLRVDMVASNRERKKSFPSWKQETGQKQNFKRGNFRNKQRLERKQDRFTFLTKTSREILALDKGKFKPPPPMTTLVEKRNASKFCEFHGEVGHTIDECMHLKRQIKEMLKAKKLLHLIKELKQNNRKDQAKTAKKGETSEKDKPLAILMVQPWQRIARQRITQTFSSGSVISFPTLGEEDGMEGPMIIEAEMGGHCVHRIYVDGGSSSEIFKDRRRGTLNIRLDEFHGGEITLSLQRDYRKAGVAIHSEHPEQTAAIGSTQTEEGRKELCGLLRRHLDVFTWKPADMAGVP
nr:hypothetical protein [Tanacetum cinerariifolium]